MGREGNYKLTINNKMSPEIEKYIYMKSVEQAKIIDGYVTLHLKKRPRWLPNFIWQWLLKQLLELSHFKEI